MSQSPQSGPTSDYYGGLPHNPRRKSQSPQSGATFRRKAVPARHYAKSCLNPLKAGQPSYVIPSSSVTCLLYAVSIPSSGQPSDSIREGKHGKG
jgi:hypothetical protein